MTFCPSCGKTTNHVTQYQKDYDGGPLIATVRCAEHSESAPSTRGHSLSGALGLPAQVVAALAYLVR